MNKAIGNEFTVHLVSSGSMDLFPDNTLANFKNYFTEPMLLEGNWKVALTEIIFPSKIKNVTDSSMYVYSNKDGYKKSNEPGVIQRPRKSAKRELTTGVFNTLDSLLNEIAKTSGLSITNSINPANLLLTLKFDDNEGISFITNEIPSILGIEGKRDHPSNMTHIGYKSKNGIQNIHLGTFPVDITAGSQLLFIYLDIIDYQFVGGSKSPTLKIIDTNRRIKNGGLTQITAVERKSFTNFEYKNVLRSTIDTIKVELRTETGKLVPFLGTGKVVLTLHFKKFGD